MHQSLNGDIIFTEVKLNFKASSNGVVTGKATLPLKNEIHQLELEGGFYSFRFLKVNYENSNRAILQFGTFIFQLSPDAKQLNGHFVGYGHVSHNIIAGSADFCKA